MGKLMAFGLALACGAMSSAAAEKHYLAAGWDVGSLYPEDFVDSLDELAKVPVDGIRFAVRGQTADGRPIDQAKAMDGIRWPDDAFDGELENVRRLTALPNMRHCFMAMRAAPNRRLRWDDDAAWETFAHNAGVLASFAKRAGVKGLCPDYEDYVHQYQYRLADDDPDYETTRALVRKRGAQVYGAVFRAFPEAIVFHWHFLDAPWCGFDFSGDVAAYYRDARNLFPAFLEGGLDALPPTGRFVAAEERDYSYRASRRDFYKAYADEKRVEPSLVSPENLLKLRTQISVGFDLYLDAYRPDNTNSVYFHAPEKGRTLAEQFLVDLEQATQATDEYVWFWGEKRAYAKWVNPGVKQKRTWIQRWGKTETWDETLPGLYDGMRRIKDPQGYVRKAIAAARASGAPNLAPSGDCTDAKAFTFWQESRFTNGTFRIDRETGCRQPGCALMTGVHGCVSTFVRNRAAGERFAIRLVSRTDGDAAASAPVHFTSGGKWNFKVPGKRIERTGRSKDGWTEHLGWIEIPEGCDGFGLQLGSYARPGDEVRFDDIEVYALPSLTGTSVRPAAAGSPDGRIPAVRTVPHELDVLVGTGHIQGAACTEEGIYLAHSGGIEMIGWDGRLIRRVDAPSHLGDIAYSDGRIYGAFVIRGKDRGNLPGMVRVWNSKLEKIAERRFPEALDGAVVLGKTLYVGVDRWGHGLHPLCCVKRLDLDLNDLGNTDVDLGYEMHYGVQTMATDGKDLFFGNYGGTSRVSADLKSNSPVTLACAEGFGLVPKSVSKRDEPVFFTVKPLGGNIQGWRKDPTNNPPRIEIRFSEYVNGAFRDITAPAK